MRSLMTRMPSLVMYLTLIFSSTLQASSTQLIKVATLAPDGSSWVKALRAIDTELREVTDDAIGLRIYPEESTAKRR